MPRKSLIGTSYLIMMSPTNSNLKTHNNVLPAANELNVLHSLQINDITLTINITFTTNQVTLQDAFIYYLSSRILFKCVSRGTGLTNVYLTQKMNREQRLTLHHILNQMT